MMHKYHITIGFGQAYTVNRVKFGLICAVGTELTIKYCLHGGWEIENFSHFEDASFECSALNDMMYVYTYVQLHYTVF